MRPIVGGLLAVSLLIALSGDAGSRAHAQERTDFEAMCESLRALDGQSGVRLGLVVVDLDGGARCDVRADESFRTASLYKLVVLAEAERQIALGEFSFDSALVIEPRHAIDDPPELRPLGAFERPAGEAARRMIQSSTNADALALRDRLGIDQVDSLPLALGMESTRLGDEFVTTPDDIATFFVGLDRGEVVSSAASESMLELLRGQLLNELIPSALPPDVAVAHKTGTLENYLHDAGIVYAPAGRYVLVAMSEHPFNQPAATALLQEASAEAFQAFALAPAGEPLVDAGVEGTESAPGIAEGVIAGFEAGRASAGGAPGAVDAGSASVPGAEAAGSGAAGGSGFDLPGISSPGLREGTLGAIALSGIAALLGVFTYGLRLRRSQGAVYNRGAVNAVAGGGERRTLMRLGIRKGDEVDELIADEAGELDEAAPVPASASVAEIEPQPVLPSPRLERMAEFFSSQQHLLETTQQQYQEEVQPLNALLARQSVTQQRLLANLETRLRPLNEYADGEEANLDALEQRMLEQGPDFIQRSFSEYLETQRQRIAETREQIDDQRLPLLAYGEDQRDAVEVALSRFDADMEALELNLAEQRKLLMRMLDAMRSDSFVAVKQFLEAREVTMSELADTGITDPGQIGHSVQNLRGAVDAMASQSVHIQSVLEATDSADERLVDSAPGSGAYPLPEPAESFDEALAELEEIESEEIAAGG